MGFVSARRPGWLLEAARERRPRGMVAYPPQGGGQNPGIPDTTWADYDGFSVHI